MTTRNVISVCLAVAFGFLLGAMLSHPKIVKAQAGLRVYVINTPSTLLSGGPTTIPGTQIVGFSCVLDRDGIFTDCYTAYIK